jgi:hypothetical protein
LTTIPVANSETVKERKKKMSVCNLCPKDENMNKLFVFDTQANKLACERDIEQAGPPIKKKENEGKAAREKRQPLVVCLYGV